ncbi:MAG: methyl-accepting chemotaxis protein [Defluviitaleaceae bacterium]|nr:methyl-accepting chemotaxis protein [Defluviitaleaceae bacterium]
MKILNNTKISGKLALGFGLVLLMTIFMSVFGIVQIRDTNSEYSYVLNYPSRRNQMLSAANTIIMDIQRITGIAGFSTNVGNTQALNELEQELHYVYSRFNQLIANYVYSVTTDPVFSEDIREERRGMILEIQSLVDSFIGTVSMPSITASRASNTVAISNLRELIPDFVSQIDAAYQVLYDITAEFMGNVDINMNNQTRNTINTMIAISVVTVLFGILIAIFITIVISKPAAQVSEALSNVSMGNLNVNLSHNSKDEMGVLAESTRKVVNTIKSLISEMNNMGAEHDRGQLDVFINANKFNGSYFEVANKVNEMVKSHLETQDKVIGVFSEISSGDFDAQLERLPGQKARMNEAVDNMRNNILDVSKSVKNMISFALEGDLSKTIETDSFTGDWQDLMVGLNRVLSTVNEPITEINKIMRNLSRGEFDTKVMGSYHGDFLSMKESVNVTIDTLSLYIKEISDILSKISSGDLLQRIDREYVGEFKEIKTSINNITATLHKTISEISAASTAVFAGAQAISSSAMNLAAGATEQSSSIEELNATIEIVNQKTKANAENATQANNISNESTRNATEGNNAMKKMLEAMIEIKESSNSIGKIIKAIQDIAFQTNLLALNAAVEAARAGEHGRGFAVVAEEVRALAGRSQTAATETTSLIEESIFRVDSGSSIAESTSKSLDSIVKSVSDVYNIINDITSASQEQAIAISQITTGIEEVAEVVQSNSAVSEETAAASEELTSQAELLKQLVNYFKV